MSAENPLSGEMATGASLNDLGLIPSGKVLHRKRKRWKTLCRRVAEAAGRVKSDEINTAVDEPFAILYLGTSSSFLPGLRFDRDRLEVKQPNFTTGNWTVLLTDDAYSAWRTALETASKVKARGQPVVLEIEVDKLKGKLKRVYRDAPISVVENELLMHYQGEIPGNAIRSVIRDDRDIANLDTVRFELEHGHSPTSRDDIGGLVST